MPPSAVARGPITTRIITELIATDFPVGDNSAPTEPHGWQGEPNAPDGHFIPWSTLTPTPGQTQATPQAFGDTGTEWRLGYIVFYAGVSRKQTEALADRVRQALVEIAREPVESETGDWQIQKISCTSIGSNNRVGSTYPDYFTQSDSFEIWVSKGA